MSNTAKALLRGQSVLHGLSFRLQSRTMLQELLHIRAHLKSSSPVHRCTVGSGSHLSTPGKPG